jgi:CRP-like cAMP-binding protein
MSKPSSIQTSLAGLAFLQGASAATLASLASLAEPVSWTADEVIFREGDRGTALYLIERGRVALEISVPGRRRATVMTLGPGDLMGWSSMIQDQPKGASARAVADTSAWAFDAVALRALCDRDHAFAYDFMRRLLREVSHRLKATRMQLLDVFGSPASDETAQIGGR